MIDTERSNPAGGKHVRLQNIGRIEPSAQTDLDNAGIGGRAAESEKGGGDGDFEEAGVQIGSCIQNLLQQRRQSVILDQLSGQPDALVVAHQMRAGGDVDALAVRLQHGAQKRAGGTFTVGAGHVKRRRQVAVRIAEPFEQARIVARPSRPSGTLSAASRSSWVCTAGSSDVAKSMCLAALNWWAGC